MPPRPQTREERRGELAAGDQAHNEGAKAKTLVHMKWQHRHRQTDDEERDEDHPHDREQIRDRAFCSSLDVHCLNSLPEGKIATGASAD